MAPPASLPGDTGAKWGVLLAIGVGAFMSAMGASAVYTALPVVTASFGADVATVEWAVTIFLLVVSTMLLSFGRLGDLRGHRRVYVWGLFAFLVGSALCGLAPTVGMLVAARAAQAVGAAMLFANGPAILTRTFPASQRGRALGMQAGMTYLGLTAGPSLGGWFTAAWGWRSVFYINIPFGLLAIVLTLRSIADDPPVERPEPFDIAGAALFTLGLGALLIGLNQGHAWGWTSPFIVAALVLACLLLVMFVVLEQTVGAPMLDVGLFTRRLFSAAVASAVLNYMCVTTVMYLVPFYLMRGRGLGPGPAGLLLTVQPIVMAITAPLSGTLSDRVGSRVPATLGMAILATGLFLLSRLAVDSPLPHVGLALAITGLGTAFFSSPNNSALMGAAPRHRQGIAAGILASARNVGMVLGVALAGAVVTTVAAQAPAGDGAALVHGITVAFLVACGLGLAGVVTSAVR